MVKTFVHEVVAFGVVVVPVASAAHLELLL